MIDQLHSWSQQLARATGGAADAARALGLPGSLAQRGGVWELTPPPAGATRLALSERDGALDYLEVQLAAPLARSALDARFGAGRALPRTGIGRPHKVAYHVEVPGAPATCEVIAAFADEPTTPEAISQSVVLRRDRI